MVTTDPIADMLTRIRNALIARHDEVDVPLSTVKSRLYQARLTLTKSLEDMEVAFE